MKLTPGQQTAMTAQDIENDPDSVDQYVAALAQLPYYTEVTINGYLFRVRQCQCCKQRAICMWFARRNLCRSCFPRDEATKILMNVSRNTWTLTIRPAYDEAYQHEKLQSILKES